MIYTPDRYKHGRIIIKFKQHGHDENFQRALLSFIIQYSCFKGYTTWLISLTVLWSYCQN